MSGGWVSVGLPLRRRPLPAVGTIELWLTDLAELPLEAGPSGLTRRERVLKRRIQQQFVLRLLLGSYLGLPGKDVRVVRGERGKPALSPDQALSGLHFNVSHSGSWLAIALTRELAVGVDIEAERSLRRPVDMARRYFPEDEAEWLASRDESVQSRLFLVQWTAREALVKATGSGLAGVLPKIRLGFNPARIQALPESWPAPARWSLIQPQMPAGVVGHVAAAASDLGLKRYFLQTG